MLSPSRDAGKKLCVKLEDRISADIRSGKIPGLPSFLQGVSKEKLNAVLAKIDRAQVDITDAVYALLDDTLPSFFTKAAAEYKFCHGASTAHIACHIGIIQRGKGKLDREGRDYWLKPLWEIGALEKVYFSSEDVAFLPGHPKAKSPNSAYRIDPSFLRILKAPDDEWPNLLDDWASLSQVRKRLNLQAELAKATLAAVDNTHLQLIQDCCKHYALHFLPGFEIIYVDDSDGDRVSEDEKSKLSQAGIALGLSDSMPDVLLWNPSTDMLWVIEAVCSDGEVDWHKMENLCQLAKRSDKKGIGFTTAYPDWKTAARRQAVMKNLAADSFLWIKEDGAKQFQVIAPEIRVK